MLLDRVGREVERSPISRLVAPVAISASTSRSRRVSRGASSSAASAEDLHAQRDHAHRLDHVGRAPVLGDEPRGARRRRDRARDRPGAGDQQHPGRAASALRSSCGQLGSRLARRGRGRPARRRAAAARPSSSASLRGGRSGAALDPRLALEQQAKAPVDDVVVVDDEHPQREVAAVAGILRPRAAISSATAAAPCARASARRAAARTRPARPAAAPRASAGAGPGRRRRRGLWRCGSMPSLVISSSNIVPRRGHADLDPLAGARASRSCEAPRGRPPGPAARGAPGPRPASGQ